MIGIHHVMLSDHRCPRSGQLVLETGGVLRAQVIGYEVTRAPFLDMTERQTRILTAIGALIAVLVAIANILTRDTVGDLAIGLSILLGGVGGGLLRKSCLRNGVLLGSAIIGAGSSYVNSAAGIHQPSVGALAGKATVVGLLAGLIAYAIGDLRNATKTHANERSGSQERPPD